MNRDFERISRIMSKLERVWSYTPSYSLGMFIWLWGINKETSDKKLEKSLDRFLSQIGGV